MPSNNIDVEAGSLSPEVDNHAVVEGHHVGVKRAKVETSTVEVNVYYGPGAGECIEMAKLGPK